MSKDSKALPGTWSTAEHQTRVAGPTPTGAAVAVPNWASRHRDPASSVSSHPSRRDRKAWAATVFGRYRAVFAVACVALLCLTWSYVIVTSLGLWQHRKGTESPGARFQEAILSIVWPWPRVVEGPPKSPLQTVTVMVAMIGRNVVGELPYVLRNIERFIAHVGKAYVVLVENDSVDGTEPYFLRWLKEANVSGELLTLPQGRRRRKKSLPVLAEARNAYLDLLSTEKYKDVEYLIPVDTDMCFPWNVTRMSSTLNNLLPLSGKEWHALYANGACGWVNPLTGKGIWQETPGSLPLYCDLFALRDFKGRHHKKFDVRLFPDYECSQDASKSLGCTHLSEEPVVPVEAAFGGLAVYRVDVLMGKMPGAKTTVPPCRYATVGWSCEHLALSECIRSQGGRQFIAQRLLVDWEWCTGNVTDVCWRCHDNH